MRRLSLSLMVRIKVPNKFVKATFCQLISINQYAVIIGGPVTHLYESLTGNNWDVHGESKYCCYSIYQQADGEATWKPLVVNQVLGADESQSPPKEQGIEPKTFTWA